jgi:hypothetical protein
LYSVALQTIAVRRFVDETKTIKNIIKLLFFSWLFEYFVT